MPVLIGSQNVICCLWPMETRNCTTPSRSLVRFDLDVQEIEDKLVSIQGTNEHIRTKLCKVASGLQAIQKYLGRGRQPREARVRSACPSVREVLDRGGCPPVMEASVRPVWGPVRSACPPARSAKLVSDGVKLSCNQLLKRLDRDSDAARPLGGAARRSLSGSRELLDPLYRRNSFRRWSLNEMGTKFQVDVDQFPSSNSRNRELHGSNQSVDSIFRLHHTLNAKPKPKARSQSNSRAEPSKNQYQAVRVLPLFQSKNDPSKPSRPTSLFICQKPDSKVGTSKDDFKPSFDNTWCSLQSTRSLDDHLSCISQEQSKKMRSEKAAKAIDSCILLMMSLVNE